MKTKFNLGNCAVKADEIDVKFDLNIEVEYSVEELSSTYKYIKELLSTVKDGYLEIDRHKEEKKSGELREELREKNRQISSLREEVREKDRQISELRDE